jgi:hypothetical protein
MRYDNKFFFTHLLCCCFWFRDPRSGIRDPGWVKIRIRDPESGINIPDPQHCVVWQDNTIMTEDEQLSPTFEEMILATVLGLVDARLPRHVRDRYLHLIGRKRSLMDYLAEILDRVPLFLAELENGCTVYTASSKGDPDQQHARFAAIQIQFFRLILFEFVELLSLRSRSAWIPIFNKSLQFSKSGSGWILTIF